MHLARLLPAAVLLSSLTTFAQDQQGTPCCGPPLPPKLAFRTDAATPSEPWRIIADQPRGADSKQDLPDRLLTPRFKLESSADAILEKSRRDANIELIPFQGDDICYLIRSYRVARDEKHSDSTHPVKSSTCQPASRYHVRSAEEPRHFDR
jgi:hypothetical protein